MELYPPNEEYDFTILDPNNVHGSPFGGFARATQSRLAALPLILPSSKEQDASASSSSSVGADANGASASVTDNNVNNDELYYEVRDAAGTLFACRVYHEDELASFSIKESVFDVAVDPTEEAAILESSRQAADKANESKETTPGADSVGDAAAASGSHKGGDDVMNGMNGHVVVSSSVDENSLPLHIQSQGDVPELEQIVDSIGSIVTYMAHLTGVCSQIHQGWWSYEWCYETKVSQFHINFGDQQRGKSDIRLDDVTVIGFYVRREIILGKDKPTVADSPGDSQHPASDDDDDDDRKAENGRNNKTDKDSLEVRMKKLAKGEIPVARVVDSYKNGDFCPETKKRRAMTVEYRCCSTKAMESLNSAVLYQGTPVNSNIAAIVDLAEVETCQYTATVCTPLLCKGKAQQFESFGANVGKGKNSKTQGSNKVQAVPKKRRPRKDNESIRETIDRILEDRCLETKTNEWWAYELCHQHNIRQYHESTATDPRTGLSTLKTETEYMLGLYNADELESYPREEETNHVVNATDVGAGDNHYGGLFGGSSRSGSSSSSSSPSSSSSSALDRGNGAYFQQEYRGGTICDDETVTDAAIKAGSVAEEKIERSSTVRYFCGPKLALVSVNEDHTCHYIVDVTIPDLCENPLFKAPIAKKQVMKCLPV